MTRVGNLHEGILCKVLADGTLNDDFETKSRGIYSGILSPI